MQVSELIKFLQDFQKEKGDVPIFKSYNDGHSTISVEYVPQLKYCKIWPNHPTPARWYLS